MKIAIVGAGFAGLAAARTLHDAGVDAAIFESNSRPGGRVETISIDGYTFDAGATSFTPRGKALADVIHRYDAISDLVQVRNPIYVHENGRIGPGYASTTYLDRYTFISGNQTLASLLADGLDIRYGSRIESMIPGGDSVELLGEVYSSVIITVPTPQAMELIGEVSKRIPATNVRYRACLSVLLGYEVEFNPPYHALIDTEQRHPLTWLSVESTKCPSRAPDGCCALVAQLGPEYSKSHLHAPDAEILSDTAIMVQRLLGDALSRPVVERVVRYPFSQPETTAAFASVNHRRDIVIAGDGVLGGRTELAYETGILAAQRVLGFA